MSAARASVHAHVYTHACAHVYTHVYAQDYAESGAGSVGMVGSSKCAARHVQTWQLGMCPKTPGTESRMSTLGMQNRRRKQSRRRSRPFLMNETNRLKRGYS